MTHTSPATDPARKAPYRVGLAASVVGLGTLLLLPFATVRHSRIATGSSVSAAHALSPLMLGALIALWALIVVLSLARGGRVRGAARGLAGAAVVVALAVASGLAATNLGEAAGRFARVSIGGGAWLSAIAAYAVVLGGRRESGGGALGALVVTTAPAGVTLLILSGRLADLGIMKEYRNVADRFWVEAVDTVVYAGAAVVLATVIGVALGVLASRRPGLERPVFSAVSVLQTIPGLAMVGLLVAPLAALSFAVPWLRTVGVGGLGWAPVVIALTLYALLAIVRNTHAGLRSVPASVTDAGTGMGMTHRQLLRRVELPLAAPVLFSGVRTSAVSTIGNATLGAFVGGITLGRFIFQGLAEQAPDLTMLGAIALVVIAVGLDATLRVIDALLFTRRAPSRRKARS